MMQPTPLPGLEHHPVSYGTAMNPYNNYYPRATQIGPNVEYHGARPPWPHPAYSNQRANIGGPLGEFNPAWGSAVVGIAFTYLTEAGKIYALSKILGIEISQKYIWLGAVALTGVQLLGSNANRWFTSYVYPGYMKQ